MDWSRRSALFAPLHYATGAEIGGSELLWSYNIAREASRYMTDADVIVGYLRNGGFGPNVRVHEVLTDTGTNFFSDEALFARLGFVAAYTRRALLLARKKHYDILHHVLPWGRTTFNPLIIARGFAPAGLAKARIVMGPLQDQHETKFDADDRAYNRFAAKGEGGLGASAVLQRTLLSASNGIAQRFCVATLNRADALVAVSESARRSIVALGVSRPVHVIPAGVRCDDFPFVERRPHDGPLRLALATYFLKRKGIDVILRGIALATVEGTDVELHLAGEGPERDSIRALAEQLGIERRIIFHGALRTAEIAALYANSDAFVSMSWAETFPAGLLEAMSTGLPPISAENVGAREIIEDSVNGTLVPLGDAEALSKALRRFRENDAWRIEMGANAAQRARTTFDWSAVGASYRELYESLLENS